MLPERSFYIMAYRDVILTDAPVEYWEFSETSGTTAASAGSSPHALTHSASVVVNQPGVAGKGVTYNGVNAASTNTGVVDFMAGTFSVEMWVKFGNPASGMDYPTFIRRDGNGYVFIIRSRSTAVGRGNIIEAYSSGRTVDTGTATFNDNKWHHIVATRSGTTLRLFVDGVEYTSGTGTASTGGSGTAAVLHVGEGSGATEYLSGSIDEVAIYQTALTPTRITAHYNAGAPVNTAGSMGASGKGTGKAGTFTGISHTGSQFGTATVTAKAGAYRGLAEGPTDYQRISFTDGWGSTGGAWGGEPYFGQGNMAAAIFDFSALPANVTFTEAFLVIHEDNNQASTGVLLEKAESFDRNVSGKPAVSGPSLTFDIEAMHGAVIDVTAMLNSLTNRSAPSFGVGPALIFSGGTGYSHFNEAGNAPRIMVKYTVPQIGVSGAFGTGYATGLASMDVRTGTSVLIGSATAIGASSTWTANAQVDPNTFTVFGTAYATAQADLSYTHSEVADFATAAGSATGGTITAASEYRVIGVFGTAYGTGRAPAPLQTNPMADDYWQAIVTSVDETNDQWYRPNPTAPQVFSPVTTELPDTGESWTFGAVGNIVGQVHYNVEGPEGRQAMHFTNAYADVNIQEPGRYFSFWSMEMTIRTTQKQATLAYGETVGSIAGGTETYLGLSGGRVKFGNLTTAQAGGAYVLGNKDVADGQWHHILVNFTGGDGQNNKVEVWIDGVLDIRRSVLYGPTGQMYAVNTYARPDVYFGSAQLGRFTGDVMEVVWRDQALELNRIRAHANAVFGIQTNNVPTSRATGQGGTWVGKGNVPEALVLWFRTNGFDITERYWQPIDASWQAGGDYDFDPQIARTDNFYGIYHIEHADVTSEGAYIDPITGEPRFRDLDKEIDLSKYDAVLFRWYPNEGVERDKLLQANHSGGTNVYMPAAYTTMRLQEMVNSLRTAIDKHGVSLLVTNPQLAVDLGAIDRVELVPSMLERSPDPEVAARAGMAASLQYYDPRGVDIDPWVNPTGEPGKAVVIGAQAPPEYYYWDTHHNNRFRVRNLVPGLTDIGGYIRTDMTWHQPHQQWELERANLHYEERSNGLNVNDEFLFDGPRNTPLNENYGYGSQTSLNTMRWHGFWAVPPQSVKAGTVVTTFGVNVWQGREQVINPYRDYATTIALQPGEMLNGKPLGAKIFISFTEQIWQSQDPFPVRYQRVPAEANESAAKRYWQYSWWRVEANKTPANNANQTGISLGAIGRAFDRLPPAMRTAMQRVFKNEEWVFADSGSSSILYQITIAEQYAVDLVGLRLPMLSRGLNWLSERVEAGPGGVVNRFGTAKATAKAPVWGSTAGLSAKGVWGTARAQAKADFGAAGSTRAFFGTAQARAKAEIKQSGRWATARATGSATMNYSITYDATDIVTLYVESGQTITLYIEEES